MLRQHPARVLGVVAAVAIALFLLSAPGADDTSGAWYYISAFGWFGFLITALLFIVLGLVVAVQAVGRRRAAH
ncbi:ABC-type antimicrobial peptide transport system permease subunit [Nocardioides ginsengisegetis]|uniref:ABC-type antimicrobial peptide transport system permease subunit n=1 Tax=Nocardioides ginsengisegetis TaxID=661491 RepID=A0A7W3J0G2_9ACTN|nr:hypothetical protein [Nocardioides ginsengisegetis]MBA8803945.1 ABC-type antimicrobial peptide transport system permease subunit [Nocardioides ginsengisegetis]